MYLCRTCNKPIKKEYPITLTGYKNPHDAGILLVECFQESRFCDLECFRTYILEHVLTDPRFDKTDAPIVLDEICREYISTGIYGGENPQIG